MYVSITQNTGKAAYKEMKTILVTGSSRGIGAATAETFARAGGWNIVLNCHSSADDLAKVHEKLAALPDTVVYSSIGDVADEAYVKSLFEEIDARFGAIDVLVNNAGTDIYGLLQDTSLETWHRVIDTNSTGAFLCCKYAIPLMLKVHKGSIVNVSSVWGKSGASYEAVYSASKGALDSLTRSLAKELGPSGIRVNAVACGFIETLMNSALSPEEVSDIVSSISLGRIGQPSEIAKCIYQISEDFTYMTGQVVTIDGGWIMP